MFSSIDYLTKKATFKQVVPSIPVTQEIPDSEKPEVFQANKKEMVESLLIKAKQIEYLINALPAAADAGQRNNRALSSESEPGLHGSGDDDFAELESEMKQVNDEYIAVLQQAEQLQGQLRETIRSMLDEHHTLSSGLLLH